MTEALVLALPPAIPARTLGRPLAGRGARATQGVLAAAAEAGRMPELVTVRTRVRREVRACSREGASPGGARTWPRRRRGAVVGRAAGSGAACAMGCRPSRAKLSS